MAVGYYELTAAASPQTVATAFEAEANISACEALGDQDETGSGIFEAATAAVNDVGNIAAGDTTITYDTLSGVIPTNLPIYIKINDEWMKVTAFDGTTFTVVRGQRSTTAAAHSDNDVITVEGQILPHGNKVIFRVVGTAVVDITNAATAVGGVQVAAGYPDPHV